MANKRAGRTGGSVQAGGHGAMAGVIFIAGLFIGSFLGVVIDRVPNKKSIVTPPSSCGDCGSRLTAKDLVPVLSYIATRGKCRHCGATVSRRYPLMEVATGLLFLLVFTVTANWTSFAAGIVFVSFLFIMFMIDFKHMILPNAINAIGFGAGVVFALLRWTGVSPLMALAGAAAGAGVLFLVAVLSKGGMGLGDAKFLGAIGAFLGPAGVMYTLFAASCLGAAVGLVQIRRGIRDKKEPMPFGPYLAMGAFVIWIGTLVLI